LAPVTDYPARPAMAVSPDGSLAIVSTYHELEGPWKNGKLWLARTSDGKRLWGEELKADDAGNLPVVRGRAFSPDGKIVAVAKYYFGAMGNYANQFQQKNATIKDAARDAGSLDGERLEIELRNVADGKLLRKSFWPKPLLDHAINGDRLAHGVNLAFSPDGQNLVAASRIDTHIFATQTGALEASLPRPKETNAMTETAAITFSPNGKLLAICRSDLIEIYDGNTFQPLQIFHTSARHLAFSPDGKWLACDDSRKAQNILVWETGSLN